MVSKHERNTLQPKPTNPSIYPDVRKPSNPAHMWGGNGLSRKPATLDPTHPIPLLSLSLSSPPPIICLDNWKEHDCVHKLGFEMDWTCWWTNRDQINWVRLKMFLVSFCPANRVVCLRLLSNKLSLCISVEMVMASHLSTFSCLTLSHESTLPREVRHCKHVRLSLSQMLHVYKMIRLLYTRIILK